MKLIKILFVLCIVGFTSSQGMDRPPRIQKSSSADEFDEMLRNTGAIRQAEAHRVNRRQLDLHDISHSELDRMGRSQNDDFLRELQARGDLNFDEYVVPSRTISNPRFDAAGISLAEQAHLVQINENLEKIKASLANIGLSYAPAGICLATAQVQGAAGQAIVGTALSIPECISIARNLAEASRHFDELSKPGVSRAAQIERDQLAPKLKEFKNKVDAIESKVKTPYKAAKKSTTSTFKSLKSKLFGKNPNP